MYNVHCRAASMMHIHPSRVLAARVSGAEDAVPTRRNAPLPASARAQDCRAVSHPTMAGMT